MRAWIEILAACAPILVALVGIIPTLLANRKKLQGALENVRKTLETHIKEDEDERARNRRYRILRFYDEMVEGRWHSESHFEDILDDIDNYEKYCDSHPNFRNNRGHVAMEAIKSTYEELKRTGRFLNNGRNER